MMLLVLSSETSQQNTTFSSLKSLPAQSVTGEGEKGHCIGTAGMLQGLFLWFHPAGSHLRPSSGILAVPQRALCNCKAW